MPLSPRNSHFNIRPARFPDDTQQVRKLFRDYQKDIDVDLCFQSFEQELATLPGRYQVVLLAEGGCAALRPHPSGAAELKRLFVYPETRGAGLGMALIHRAIEEAKQLGYTRIFLDTIRRKMPSAIRMYQALGFVEIPARGGKTGLPDLIEMELNLASFAAGQTENE